MRSAADALPIPVAAADVQPEVPSLDGGQDRDERPARALALAADETSQEVGLFRSEAGIVEEV